MSTVSKVYSNIRGLQTAIKDVGRLRQIVVVLGRHGFGAVVAKLGLHETVGLKGFVHTSETAEAPASRARRIRWVIEELGPTFIKLGQILSTRPDLIPADVLDELQSLQDAVAPMPWPEVRETLEEELGAAPEDVLDTVEPEPLASASIAQVHAAKLRQGDDVVLKVRRRGIAATVESDLSILDFMARRAAELITELELVDPVGIVREFDRAIRRELDFSNERRHIDRFRRNFEGHETISIPHVYGDLCTPRLITMERIHGVKVTQAPQQLGVDPYDLAPKMMRAILQMVLTDGLFHGDLHPGNILVMPSGRVALIDFGLVGRLGQKQRDSILDLLIGIGREDYQMVSRVVFDIGIKVPGVRYDYNAFEADVVEVVERHVADTNLSDIDVQGLFSDLLAGAIRHRIKMPPNYTMVFKALITVEGIGKTLAPQMNFLEEAKPFVRDVVRERYSPKRLLREGAEIVTTARRLLRQLPLSASQLLHEAEQGNLTVRVQVSDVQPLVAERRRSARLLGRTTLASALTIAAALTLEAPMRRILGVSTVSAVLFGIALVVGLPAVWCYLRPSKD